MRGLLRGMQRRWRGAEAPCRSHVSDMTAALAVDSAAGTHARTHAADDPDTDVAVCAEEQAAFLAGLPDTTGRTLDEWMAYIAVIEASATRNGIIDLLRVRGFEFRWANMLACTFIQRRSTHPAPPALPPAPSPDWAPASPPGLSDSVAAASGTIARVSVTPRPLQAALHSNPRAVAAEHAGALLVWLATNGLDLPPLIPWERLNTLYSQLCTERGWQVRPWQTVATELSRLTSEPRNGRYQYVLKDGLEKRLRFYRRDLLLGAFNPKPAAASRPMQLSVARAAA